MLNIRKVTIFHFTLQNFHDKIFLQKRPKLLMIQLNPIVRFRILIGILITT